MERGHHLYQILMPYFRRKFELTLQDGCVIWGKRVVIPKPLRDQLLKGLHVGHVGICRMKALARSYIWWLHLNQDIEAMASLQDHNSNAGTDNSSPMAIPISTMGDCTH